MVLDDGTELESVPEDRLRMPKSAPGLKRASSWECLECLAKDHHLRQGKAGKAPLLKTSMKKDEVRGVEELLGQELVKGLKNAFSEADSMKEGELDVGDCLTAFTALRRVAARKDVLVWLRTRSTRVRTRRTLSFVEFCKCFAGIFHSPSSQSVASDVRERDPRQEPALFADENSIVSEWARTLGRKRLLELEQAFKRRAAPHVQARGTVAVLGQVRSGVPARDVRLVFRDVGYDIAPARFASCLRDSGVLPDDFLSFPEVVGAYHALFIKDGIMPEEDDRLGTTLSLLKPPGKAIEGGSGCLRSLAEVASVIFAEQRWEGTPLQHVGLVRRLCVGRPAAVQEAVRKVRDAFEACDVDDEGQLGADEASKLLDEAGVKGLKELREEVLKAFLGDPKDDPKKKKKGKRDSPKKRRDRSRSRSPSSKKKDRSRSPRGPPPFSLAEFFAHAGHLIEAVASSEATVASAMAQLRLSATPAEVRGAAIYAAKLVQDALQGNAKTSGRIATDDPLYSSKLGRLRGGLELIQASGFTQHVVEGKPKREFLVCGKDKMKLEGALKDIEVAFGEEVGCPSVQGCVRDLQEARLSEDDLRQALHLAKRLVANVLKTPGDQRVFRVRGTNPAVKRGLTRHAGGPRLLEAVGFKPDQDGPDATFALERRGLQENAPGASKGSRAFKMQQLDKETKAFLHRALADIDEALQALGDDQKPAAKKSIGDKERLLAERMNKRPGKESKKESKGKERAEKPAKKKGADKRDASELEKALKSGGKVQEAQLQLCRKAFENLDVDGDQLITPKDLKVAFARDGREAFGIPAWIKARDLDQDGAVSFDDFLHSVASSFALPANAKAKKGNEEGDDGAIAAAVGVLRLSATPRDVADVCQYVHTKLSKILDEPSEAKHWRLMLKDAKLTKLAGGTTLLQACGFCGEENGAVLALRDPNGKRWDRVPEEMLEKLRAARSELAGRSLALATPGVPDIAAVSRAVDALDGDPDAWAGAIDLSITYVKNVLQDPKDDRKRRIQATCKVFESTLKVVPGGLELMNALGFREVESGVWTMARGFDESALRARLLELESCVGPLKDRAKRRKDAPKKKPLGRVAEKHIKASSKRTKAPKLVPPTKQAPKKENEKPGNPKVEARLRELEKLALAKKRELEASSKALAKTKKLADDLAKRLHEAKAGKTRTQSNREVGLKLPKAAPPKRKAPAKAKKPPPTRGKDGGPTDVTSTLTKAAVKGATKLEIDNSHEWEVGSKVVIGAAPDQESKFVIGLGSIILSSPLERAYGVHTPLQMYRPTKDEKEQFTKAQAILCVHSVLGETIDAAMNEGERVVRGRLAQKKQDARFVPRSVVVARPVFCRPNARLAGCAPALGRLLVAQDGVLQGFCEGFSLSDLARLFDRVDPGQSGRASASSLASGARDDADVAAAFGDFSSAGDVEFIRDVLPHLWRGDATALLRKKLPPGTSCTKESSRLSQRALEDLDLVFRAHMDASGRLPFASLASAFADLEGRGPAAVERDIMERTVAALRSEGCDALALDDLVDARARHLADLAVPIINGTFSGGGINGWRRPCLKILRQLWAKVCKVQAKVRRLDAAPGDVFADACKKDEAVKRFLPLDVATGTTLRDALASISQKQCYVRWRHVEALVFGELGAPNASFHSQVDEVYRRGPLDLLRFDSSSTAPHDETAADLALQSGAKTKSVLLEVVTDPVHGLVFALTSDGVLDAWDTASTKRIGKAPFLCVAPEPSPGEDARPLPRKLAARMLAMAPRTQILYLDVSGRALYVNTTCGDRCVRIHELSGLHRIKRLRLALPKMKSFGKRGYWDAPDASGLMDPRWSTHGALDAFSSAPHEGVLVGSVVGDDRVYAFDLTSGAVRKVYCGHSNAVNGTVVIPDLRLYATCSSDTTIRVWPACRREEEVRGLAALREVISAAVADAGPRPGFRDGVVGGSYEDLDLVEVEFEDDGSAELLQPKRLKAPPSEYRPDVADDRPGRLRRGARVTVRHGKRQLGLERLFEAWDARGCGAVPAAAVAVGLQALKELLVGSVDQDVLARLDPTEAAFALAAASGSDGFVRLDALEDLVLEETGTAVAAKRIFKGHAASVTALTYAPLSGLLASASNDGSIRLWDPRGDWRGVVAFSQAPHVCATPGYYRALEDEWCAVEACGDEAVSLKRMVEGNPWGDDDGRRLVTNSRAKFRTSRLLAVHVSLGARESRIENAPDACRGARAVDDRVEEDGLVAYLYLLDDGDLVVSVATSTFDDRRVLLRAVDAALFEGGDAGLKRAFQERHRVLRVAYCASKNHATTISLLAALKSVPDALDRPLLARARGGDGDTLQKLGLDLALFCRTGQDAREDVCHVVRATRFDASAAVCADASRDTACELLAADVALSDGKLTRRAVCCWALGRAAIGSRRERAGVRPKQRPAGYLAAHAALCGWRVKLHAIRSGLADQCRGLLDASAAARLRNDEVAVAARDVVLRPKRGARRVALATAFREALNRPATTREARAVRRFHATAAHRRAIAMTGLAVPGATVVLQGLREAATSTELFDADAFGLADLPARTGVTLADLLARADRSATYSINAPAGLALTRPVTQPPGLLQSTGVVPHPLAPAVELDPQKLEEAVVASDLGALLTRDCRRVAGAARNREGAGGWLSAWARHQEASAWKDRIRVARAEALAAADPAARRVDTALLDLARTFCVGDAADAKEQAPKPPPRCALTLKREGPARGEAGFCAFREARAVHAKERLDVLLCRVRRGTFGASPLASSPSLGKCASVCTQVLLAEEPNALVFADPGAAYTPLRALLDDRGGLGTSGELDSVGAFWFGQILSGVGHCHAHGVLVQHVRSDLILVDTRAGDACKLCLAAPAKLDQGILRQKIASLNADDALTPPEAIVLHVHDDQIKPSCAAASRHAYRVTHAAPTATWDSWGLGVLAFELAAGDRPAAFGPQLAAFLRRRGATAEDLRHVAGDFHYAPFHAPPAKRARRSTEAKVPVDEALRAGDALKALDGGGWPAAWTARRRKRDAPAVDAVRDALASHARLLTAHRPKRSTASLADDVLEAVEERKDGVPSGLTEDDVLAVLGDGFGFPFDRDQARVLVRACENDVHLLVEELEDAVSSRPPRPPGGVLLCCAAACLRPDPDDRPLARSMLAARWLEVGEDAFDDAKRFVRGEAKPWAWLEHRVVGPLLDAEADLLRGELRSATAQAFCAACVAAERIAAGLPRHRDDRRARKRNEEVCDAMINRHDVPHRVVDVALNLKRLETRTGDAHGACCGAAAALVTRILVLADDPDAPAADHAEFACRAAAKALYGDAAFPLTEADELSEAFTRVAPGYLATVVHACRALARPGAGASNRRAAATAFANVFRLEAEQDSAAKELADADCATLLLPLASDAAGDVRVATLRCCLNACEAGFTALAALRRDPDASAASVAKDPRVRLARAFCQAPWVACCSRSARSQDASEEEAGVALEALGVMAQAGDDGLRHWGAGGALPALVHVLKKGDATGVTRGRQDTAEAGGGTHRLLQPFPEKSGGSGRSAGARRALGLILRGDAHFKKVLLKAHPGVCGAGGGVY